MTLIAPQTMKKTLRGQSPEVAANKAKNAKRKRISLAIDSDLFTLVEDKAGHTGMNVTELINFMLRKFLPEVK